MKPKIAKMKIAAKEGMMLRRLLFVFMILLASSVYAAAPIPTHFVNPHSVPLPGSGFQEHFRDENANSWLCQAHDMDNNYWHAAAKTPIKARHAAYNKCRKNSHYKDTCKLAEDTPCRPGNSDFHTCIVKDAKTGQLWREDHLYSADCKTVIHACQHWVFNNPQRCIIVDQF